MTHTNAATPLVVPGNASAERDELRARIANAREKHPQMPDSRRIILNKLRIDQKNQGGQIRYEIDPGEGEFYGQLYCASEGIDYGFVPDVASLIHEGKLNIAITLSLRTDNGK